MNSVTLNTLTCEAPDDWAGHDQCRLDVFVDGALQDSQRREIRAGDTWSLGATYNFETGVEIQLTNEDLLPDEGLVGVITIDALSADQDTQSITEGDAVYLLQYTLALNMDDTGTDVDPRAASATEILNSDRIALATGHVSGVDDSANALQNLTDVSNGELASRSSYGNAPGGTTQLSAAMLDAMLQLAETYTFSVSEIAGGSHSRNSRHYAGVAFDANVINGEGVSDTHPDYEAFMQDCRTRGATEVLGPGSPGHDTHVHCAWPRQ